MKRRTVVGIGMTMAVTSLLLGCSSLRLERTGTFYSDTMFSAIVGRKILVGGYSYYGVPLAVGLGGYFTLRALLFSWWWDTLCIPYDLDLRSKGVDIYVYDQFGKPVEGAVVSAYDEMFIFPVSATSDAAGRARCPRSTTGFESICVKHPLCEDYQGKAWLKHPPATPQDVLEYLQRNAVELPSTNSLRTLNIFVTRGRKEAGRPMLEGQPPLVE